MLILLLLVCVGGAVGQSQQRSKLSAKYTSLDDDLTPAGSQYNYPPSNTQQQQQQYYGPPVPQQRPQQKKVAAAVRPQYPNSVEKLTSSEERELEQELEDQKPDRLQELMAGSKFECAGKKDGYYADDSLNCEVFHYCQAGGKHSWLCPNQFAFHQIHLICVPPSSDSICQKSPDYHFVNDYLYRPINQKQADAYNMSLKYADRFFPEGYGGENGNRELMPQNNERERYYEGEESEEEAPPPPRRQPHPQQKINYVQRPHPPVQATPPQQPHRLTNHQALLQQSPPRQANYFPQQQQSRPQRSQQPNYYNSPTEINIPLTARRPLPSNKGGGFRPSPSIERRGM